jgi:glycosyltransferase involved in cell wall biosynthesis
VADEYPWPARTGYRLRLHWILVLLSRHASLDLLVVLSKPLPSELPPPPPDVPLAELRVVRSGEVAIGPPHRAWSWLTGRLPRALVGRSWETARAQLADWPGPAPDAVWFSHSPLYVALRAVVARPHVVDLDNLESSLLRHRRRSQLWRHPQGINGRLRAAARAGADLVDEHRWRRLEHQIARSVEAVVVCSRLDQVRLGEPGVRVVPNGYELPPGGRGRPPATPTADAPVLLLVGLLTYEPNRDGAAFFAAEVLPLVRVHYPHAQFRVVGRYGSPSDVAALRGREGVTVTGEVEDVSAELAAADVVVVPVRFGGGTRVKILEAFAHQVPVVSTTVGCEGLEVVDGEHLLVADAPEALAAACVRLLQREDLRRRVVVQARKLWQDRYRWEALEPDVAGVLRAVGSHGV